MSLNKQIHTPIKNVGKSVAKGAFSETEIEPGFFVLTFQNTSDSTTVLEKAIDSSFIQFHFCLKGRAEFSFNKNNYFLDLPEESTLLLYNPQKDLPINLISAPRTWTVSILISIKIFHSLFSHEANYISFLEGENKLKKYYKNGYISPSMAIVLNQIINYNLNTNLRQLYFKAKVYEILSLFFNIGEDVNIEQCPFLADESNVIKIKAAKNIIIQRIVEPPTLSELSTEIDLSLKKLKKGFKQIYGTTVYGFLFDYKMELARKLLESGSHNVNEVGLKVGYSTASHFIAAFKKQYGTTPKKYVQSLI